MYRRLIYVCVIENNCVFLASEGKSQIQYLEYALALCFWPHPHSRQRQHKVTTRVSVPHIGSEMRSDNLVALAITSFPGPLSWERGCFSNR